MIFYLFFWDIVLLVIGVMGWR